MNSFHSTRRYIGTAVGPLHPALHRNGGWPAPPGVTSERRLEGLCIHFLICCLLSVCNIFTTRRLMSIYKVYSIGRTWSWPVMSAPACFNIKLVLYHNIVLPHFLSHCRNTIYISILCCGIEPDEVTQTNNII